MQHIKLFALHSDLCECSIRTKSYFIVGELELQDNSYLLYLLIHNRLLAFL